MSRKTPWEDEFTPLCERCGYVIDGLPTEGDCPECGKPIVESLPERRVGTPWQRRRGLDTLLATGCRTLLRPWSLLGVMRVDANSARSLRRAYLALASLAAAPLLSLVALLFFERPTPLPGGGEMAWTPGSQAGSIGLIAALCLFTVPLALLAFRVLALIEESGLRIFGSRRGFRITRAISGTIGAHGSVGWVVVGLGCAMVAWGLLPMEEEMGRRPPRTSWLVAGSAVALAGFLVFEVFAFLGLRRCRFANRCRPSRAPETGESEQP